MADTTPQTEMGDAELRQRHDGRQVEIRGPHGGTRRVSVANMTQDDSKLAAKFGYKPVFKREFGYLATFSFAVSISGLFSTVMTTLYYPLVSGGASSVVWCWFISGAGCMCIAVSSKCHRLKNMRLTRYTSALSLSWSPRTRRPVVFTSLSRAWLLRAGCLRSVGTQAPEESLLVNIADTIPG
jgi:hypothetical protein